MSALSERDLRVCDFCNKSGAETQLYQDGFRYFCMGENNSTILSPCSIAFSNFLFKLECSRESDALVKFLEQKYFSSELPVPYCYAVEPESRVSALPCNVCGKISEIVRYSRMRMFYEFTDFCKWGECRNNYIVNTASEHHNRMCLNTECKKYLDCPALMLYECQSYGSKSWYNEFVHEAICLWNERYN
jgi:hypothetical protein